MNLLLSDGALATHLQAHSRAHHSNIFFDDRSLDCISCCLGLVAARRSRPGSRLPVDLAGLASLLSQTDPLPNGIPVPGFSRGDQHDAKQALRVLLEHVTHDVSIPI